MGRRPSLQSELQALIGPRADGKQNVYFQPPESVKLNYPCIVYNETRPSIHRANDKAYEYTQCYEITLIGKDAEWDLPEMLVKHFRHITIERFFVSDNLYHVALTLYY